jgi:putative membrane protein
MMAKVKIATVLILTASMGVACATRPGEEPPRADSTPVATTSPVTDATTSPMAAASPTPGTAATPLSAADQDFAMKAAQGGQMEVQLGQLAAQKAVNEDVRQFGQRMADDHSRANQELMRLASQHNVALPEQMSAEGQKTYDRLSKLSGSAFDREYMSHMVKDHMKGVAEFEKASNQVANADLKSFAAATLPALREHLEMAREIAGKAKAK